MGDVIPMPLTRSRATEIVREIALDSKRWTITVQYKDTQKWRGLVNRRQVEWCLQDGYVLEDKIPLHESGYWVFTLGRVCAGLDVVVEVAVENGPPLPKLFVTRITGDEIVISEAEDEQH
jgi:hypothetical protein